VYATGSTLYVLLTQDRQVACFAAVAAVLAPGGRFVVDAFVPLRQHLITHIQNLDVRGLSDTVVDLSVTRHDRPPNGSPSDTAGEIPYAWPSNST